MTKIDIDSQKVISILFISLLVFEICLVFGDIFLNVKNILRIGPLRSFFNIAHEASLGSWFSVTQTWMCGITAALVWFIVRAQDAHIRRKIGWAIIALFLMYMAMDDGAKFHERVGSGVRDFIQGSDDNDSRQIGFFPSYTWQLVFFPIFFAFGIFLIQFLSIELKVLRDKLLIVASVLILGLAVVADFFEGIDSAHPLHLFAWVSKVSGHELDLVLHLSRVVEEFLEMLAMTILWTVFLRHLVRTSPELQLRFKNLPK